MKRTQHSPRRGRYERWCRLAVWVLPAVFAQACADDESLKVSEAEQALWTPSGGVEYWPNNRIEVCFGAERWQAGSSSIPEPAPTGSPAWVQQTERIRAVIEQNYETIPGAQLDFFGFGVCPQPQVGTATGKLRITVRDGGHFNWAFRHCGPGEYYAGTCGGSVGYTATREAHIVTSQNYKPWGPEWDGAVIHEVAHALGFKHEFDRVDRDPPGDCRTDSGGTMTGRFLTTYDPESNTNYTYCNRSLVLTPLDQLGVEIVYPRAFSGRELFTRAASFRAGDGTMVLRSDDAVITDWTARGALAGAYADSTVRWFRNGTSLGSTLAYSASQLPAGVSQLQAQFTDPRGRQHTSSNTTLDVNSSRHTALLMTLL